MHGWARSERIDAETGSFRRPVRGRRCDNPTMPVGKCQNAFGLAAARDGLRITKGVRFPWLCEQGHLGLQRIGEVDPAVDLARLEVVVHALQAIFDELGGDAHVLADGRATGLPGDYVHEPTGALIEIDEHQHFTSFRLASLELYPPESPLGFDRAEYMRLCRRWRDKADRYRRSKEARCFGAGGRQRQRAYYDALRDLAAPVFGWPSVIRVDATHDDGARAYRQHRARIRERLGVDG